jgi:hypothetical protein
LLIAASAKKIKNLLVLFAKAAQCVHGWTVAGGRVKKQQGSVARLSRRLSTKSRKLSILVYLVTGTSQMLAMCANLILAGKFTGNNHSPPYGGL